MNDVSHSLVSSSFVDAHPPRSPFALQHLSGQREKTRLAENPKVNWTQCKSFCKNWMCCPDFSWYFSQGAHDWFYWFCHLPCFIVHCLKVWGNYFSAQRKGSLPHNQAIRKHHGIGVAMVVPWFTFEPWTSQILWCTRRQTESTLHLPLLHTVW